MRTTPIHTLSVLAMAYLCAMPNCSTTSAPNTQEQIPRINASMGISTALTSEKQRYRSSEAILLRLTIRNHSNATLSYNSQQVGVNDPFRVVNWKNQELAFLGGQVMTVGPSKSIESGGTVILLPNYDLTLNYPIDAPGIYIVQFRGSLAGFPPDMDIPPSNKLEIEVQQ